jgi:putative redox protein
MSAIVVQSQHSYRTAIQIGHHTVFADEKISDGGTDSAPTPMEIFIGTLGACIAVTVRAYAQRKNWALDDVTVELEMVRHNRENYPNYTGDAPFIHEFREKVHFEGALTDEQIERLQEIARKCPIRRVLENPVFFQDVETTTI